MLHHASRCSRPLRWTLRYMHCAGSIVVKVQCQVLNRQREMNFDIYSKRADQLHLNCCVNSFCILKFVASDQFTSYCLMLTKKLKQYYSMSTKFWGCQTITTPWDGIAANDKSNTLLVNRPWTLCLREIDCRWWTVCLLSISRCGAANPATITEWPTAPSVSSHIHCRYTITKIHDEIIHNEIHDTHKLLL